MLKLSIIIIGYNVEKYVERCLNSVYGQQLLDCEVIFIDDGSTDSTKWRVSEFKKKYKITNLIYIRKDNGGANSARKFGCDVAQGKYITFIDCDDWVTDKFVEEIISRVDLEADIIAFRYRLMNDECTIDESEEENSVFDCDGSLYLEAIMDCSFSHALWGKAYRKEFLLNANFSNIPSITMGDDLAAQILLGINNPRVLGVNSIIYNYYYNPQSISKNFSAKTIEILDALEYMKNVLEEKDLLEKYRKYMEYHYFRTFLFYVVRNCEPNNKIQKSIYDFYKIKNIKISDNMFIVNYLKHRPAEAVLMHIYILNYKLGCRIASLFLKCRRFVK